MAVSSVLTILLPLIYSKYYTDAGFDNWLDAVDLSYCGEDDPDSVSSHLWLHLSHEFLFQNVIYPDPRPGGFKGRDFLENVVLHVNDGHRPI